MKGNEEITVSNVTLGTMFQLENEVKWHNRPNFYLEQKTIFNALEGVTVVMLRGTVYSGVLDTELEVVGKGVAKCSPNDTFYKRNGFNVAYARAVANLMSDYAKKLAQLI